MIFLKSVINKQNSTSGIESQYPFYVGFFCYFQGFFILFFVLLASSSFSLHAQQLIYDHYGIRDGLSNRVVTDVVYDRQNLIWVATENGLNRFDGYEFITFSSNGNPSDLTKLSQTQIKNLSLGKDGRIILFYQDLYSSFDIIDPISFQVEKIEVLLEVEGEPRSLYADRNGDIFVLSKTNNTTVISIFDYNDYSFSPLCTLLENWDIGHATVNFAPTNAGKFIVYDVKMGLRIITPGEKLADYIPIPLLHSNIFNNANTLSFLHPAKDGKMWLSYQDRPGVFHLDEAKLESILFSDLPNEETYTNVWEDKAGNLIFNQAENRGNYPISKQLFCLQSGRNIINCSNLLGVGHYILSINSPDFSQSIFIGTDTGLKVVQNSNTQVEQYFAQNITANKRGFSMRGMCTDGNENVYFAREINCWYKLDLRTNLVDTIYLYDSNNRQLKFTRGIGILFDTTGLIWGASGNGTGQNIGLLHRYDIENCTNRIYYYKDLFTAYAAGNDNQIWLGAKREDDSGSLVYFDKATQKFVLFLDLNNQNPFTNAIIHFILPDGNDILWVGTEKGLFKVNLHSRTWTHYMKGSLSLFPQAKRVDLSNNLIYSLYKNRSTILWIGTRNGLTSFNTQNNTWETYYKDDGLASETVASILPGKNKTLWISTYNGLSYFTPKRHQSRHFFMINGLSHNEFNRFSSLIDKNGRYYFGSVNGVNAFRPEDFLVSPNTPKVLLTAYTHFDTHTDSTTTYHSNLIRFKENVVIEPNIKFFSFDFALPTYMPTMSNQFRYKINEDAPEWIYLKKEHRLRFNNLEAGSYTIYVQGADSSGNWSKESLIINLLVKQVFYLRWWFIISASLVFMAGIYGLLQYRLEEKLRMERLRTQLASDLHDEVSGLLAGISMQSELLRSQITEEHLVTKLINIRKASQRAMSNISDVIWSIDSRRDRIEDLITRMEEHADEVLLPINIRYKIKTNELDPMKTIPVDIRQDVYFIYKEAINNVAKHAHADFVDILISNEGLQFEMIIKDNGKPPKNTNTNLSKTKRKGQGLANLKMRSQRLNAQLTIITSPNYTIHLQMKRFS